MNEFQMIPRNLISWREQGRKHFDEAALAELAETIRLHGILEPIGVVKEGDGYVGEWGQRRWLGAGLAGLESVPAVVREKSTNLAQVIEVRLIENLAREQLTPLEQANGLAQLIEVSGLPACEVAKRVGLNRAAVSKSLALLKLPTSVQAMIDAGALSAGAAYELTRLKDKPLVQEAIAESVAKHNLSRDAISAQVKNLKNPAGEASTTTSRVRPRPGRMEKRIRPCVAV